MMYGIKIECYTNLMLGRNQTYVIEPYPDAAEIGTEITYSLLDVAIQQINANKWIYYVFKTDNDLYIKKLETAVNKRNKLNKLDNLKNG